MDFGKYWQNSNAALALPTLREELFYGAELEAISRELARGSSRSKDTTPVLGPYSRSDFDYTLLLGAVPERDDDHIMVALKGTPEGYWLYDHYFAGLTEEYRTKQIRKAIFAILSGRGFDRVFTTMEQCVTEDRRSDIVPPDEEFLQIYRDRAKGAKRFVVLGSQLLDFAKLQIRMDELVVHPFDEYYIEVKAPLYFRADIPGGIWRCLIHGVLVLKTADDSIQYYIDQTVGESTPMRTLCRATRHGTGDRGFDIEFWDISEYLDVPASYRKQVHIVAVQAIQGFLYSLDHRAVKIVHVPDATSAMNRQQRRAAGLVLRDTYKIYIPPTFTVRQIAQEIATADPKVVRGVRGHDRRGHLRTDRYGRKRIEVREARVKGGVRDGSPYPIYKAENVGMEGLEL